MLRLRFYGSLRFYLGFEWGFKWYTTLCRISFFFALSKFQKSEEYWTEHLDTRISGCLRYFPRERWKKITPSIFHVSHNSYNRPGCRVGERIYVEGEMVRDIEWKATCDNCFCAMGAIRCVPLACAPPLQGCSPIVREGQCCPSTYNCSEFHANSHRDCPTLTPYPAVHARIVFSAELIVKFLGQEYCLSFSDHYEISGEKTRYWKISKYETISAFCDILITDFLQEIYNGANKKKHDEHKQLYYSAKVISLEWKLIFHRCVQYNIFLNRNISRGFPYFYCSEFLTFANSIF